MTWTAPEAGWYEVTTGGGRVTRRQPMFPVRRTELREEIPAGYRTLPGQHVHDGGSLLADQSIRRCRCGEPVTEGRYGWRELNGSERWRHRHELGGGAAWLFTDEPERDWDSDRWHWRDWLLHPVAGWLNWLRSL